MGENNNDLNDETMENEDNTKERNKKTVCLEVPGEKLTIFTCLIDMIALEEGVFGTGTSTSRIARARRNLQYGLQLKDGSIFRYTQARGARLDDGEIK